MHVLKAVECILRLVVLAVNVCFGVLVFAVHLKLNTVVPLWVKRRAVDVFFRMRNGNMFMLGFVGRAGSRNAASYDS